MRQHTRADEVSRDWAVLVRELADTDGLREASPHLALRNFMCARLRDELRSGRVRTADAASLVEQIFVDLDAGRPVELWTLRLLLMGYRDRPDYRSEWTADFE